jgi:aminopeptidase N
MTSKGHSLLRRCFQPIAGLSPLPVFLLLGAFTPSIRSSAQAYNPIIDVQHYDFSLRLTDDNDRIEGDAAISVQFRKTAPSCWLDLAGKDDTGKGMEVLSVREGNKPVRFHEGPRRLTIYSSGESGSRHTYTIRYQGIPADGLIISRNKYGHRGFFGDNWPDRAHHWLPCVDDPSDKATVDFRITAPDHYQVVANGSMQEEKDLPGHFRLTHWKEGQPLSPKVMVIGVTEFAIDHPGDAEGVPIINYVYPEDKERGFRSYAFPLQILPFYISHIGPYPFEKCGNVQSKTRFGGLENASAIFYYENSVSSPDVESLMAHEIAHQWFGDAATESTWRDLWLSEGFATYMTHCYLENKYGIDTLKKGMEKDRAKLIAFEKRRLSPVVDTSVHGDYMQLLNPNSYEKGGWVLHMLRRRLGDSLFWKGISKYYTTYRNQNASSADFERVMEKISGQDLHTFFRQWLFRAGHPHLRTEGVVLPGDKKVSLVFTQTQEEPYEFPLEFSLGGAKHIVMIRGKETKVLLDIPTSGRQMVLDPDVNVLADFDAPVIG